MRSGKSGRSWFLGFFGPACAAAALVAATPGAGLASDTVERRDGSTVSGSVVSVDRESVVLDTESGTVRLPRGDVESIRFGRPVPPLRVEIRNVRSDDALDVFLDGQPVLVDARESGSWIDVTDRLKNGNNPIRFRIRNARATWAYQVHLRLNGRVVPIECGTPLRAEEPCTAHGHTGREIGVIDDIPTIWIHVDREIGRVELLP